ncbi:MAG: single-stranded-DNA-specific exonuclease RecJ [Alphaproteobacteria bacterium]|nr:single-stranded-DNA-specific exonuclease RecJ [Alphaproteobacteria bacterium]
MAAGKSECVLGVSRSFGGKEWRSRLDDERLALALTQRLSVPEIVGRVLAARGVDVESARDYLNPTLRDLLPDPLRFRDMETAVERVLQALQRGEQVAVFGDYDVDGATSSALLKRFAAAIGLDLRIYIPDRLTEGYGPNLPALLALREEGIAVVITVDCGITAFDALAGAAEAGIDVIVLDHHVAEPKLPAAAAVVNPNRLDEDGGHGYLAAVGVTFLFIVALNRRLREAGWYDARPEPDLRRWLDLVALGTVCDVVPLQGLNRAFVAQGLKVLAKRGNIGLSALADVGRIDEVPGTFHVGYILGPRINAGGRVGQADLGARLLISDDPAEARAIAERLDVFNSERRAIEQQVLEEAGASAESTYAADPCILVAATGWHPGVVGIVAGRLRERFNRPACVVGIDDGIGRGSGRSVRGVDLGAAIIAAGQSGLLVNGGGHAMAAGFTVTASGVEKLRAFLNERVGGEIEAKGIVPSLGIDSAVTTRGASPGLLAILAQAGPFGAGNPEPRFVVPVARLAFADVVGQDHVRCTLSDDSGGQLKGIAFRSVGTALGQALLDARGGTLHVAGHLRADTWQGRDGVQLIIEDAAETA